MEIEKKAYVGKKGGNGKRVMLNNLVAPLLRSHEPYLEFSVLRSLDRI